MTDDISSSFPESVRRDSYIVWPGITSPSELDDLLPRLLFHFRDDQSILITLSTEGLFPSGDVPPYFPIYSQRCSIEYLKPDEAPTTLQNVASQYRGVLIYGKSGDSIPDTEIADYPNVARIDPRITEYETIQVHKLLRVGESERLQAAQLRFLRWKESLVKKEKAYILCTGPSLARYSEFDFSDGYVITCNTSVSNSGLLSHAPPDVVAACDPVFHWGPSTYAYTFRKDLSRASMEIPFSFFSLSFYHHVIAHHLDIPEDRIFEVAQRYGLVMGRMDRKWEVPQTGNVLTLMLLPIGHTLAEDILIIGADGREPNETYFWKHDPKSQLVDEMHAAKSCHPAFFSKRNYEAYYEDHCRLLQDQVVRIEKAGGRVRSLTPSYIPCLRERGSMLS